MFSGEGMRVVVRRGFGITQDKSSFSRVAVWLRPALPARSVGVDGLRLRGRTTERTRAGGTRESRPPGDFVVSYRLAEAARCLSRSQHQIFA